jgi:hypothetical protein
VTAEDVRDLLEWCAEVVGRDPSPSQVVGLASVAACHGLDPTRLIARFLVRRTIASRLREELAR